MPTPPRTRPTPVTVIDILNIIFGSVWLLCYTCGGLILLVVISAINSPEAQTKEELIQAKAYVQVFFDSAARHIPFYQEFAIGEVVFSFIMTLVLLVAGIGLLALRPWARTTCLVYSILSILARIADLIYSMVFVSPNQAKVMQEVEEWLATHLPNAAPASTGGASPLLNMISSAVGTAIFLIYPVIVLVFMLLPRVTAAFYRRDEPPPSEAPGVDDFTGYDRPYGPDDLGQR